MKYEITLGKDSNGKIVNLDLFADFSSPVLIDAGDGTGNVGAVLRNIMLGTNADKVGFVLAGTENFGLAKYAKLGHLVRPVTKTVEDARTAIMEMGAEVSARQKLSKKELANVSPIVLIIGDIASCVGSSKQIADALLRIAQSGRAVGIGLVSVKTGAKSLMGIVKANCLTTQILMRGARGTKDLKVKELIVDNFFKNYNMRLVQL